MTRPRPITSDVFVEGYFAIAAEGARIGLLSCAICGAAVVIGPGEENDVAHALWHAERGEEPPK